MLIAIIPRPTFPVMADNATSALFGDPPNTQRDYYIIRGMERSYGVSNADPNGGFTYFASAPAGYVHETKTVSILAGLVIMILAILIPTVTRLALRASIPAMSFGSDDWAIILAAVSFHNPNRVLVSLKDKNKLIFYSLQVYCTQSSTFSSSWKVVVAITYGRSPTNSTTLSYTGAASLLSYTMPASVSFKCLLRYSFAALPTKHSCLGGSSATSWRPR